MVKVISKERSVGVGFPNPYNQPVACNNGAGDSNTKTFKSRTPLLIRKVKLKNTLQNPQTRLPVNQAMIISADAFHKVPIPVQTARRCCPCRRPQRRV